MKSLSIIFFTLLSLNLHSLTFKSDGTIIKSDGSYLKKPPFLIYQQALSNYLNGEPVPEDWPTVKKNSNGQPLKVKGYFGEKILEEGAPLFSIPKSLSEDVIKSLALQNGLMKDQFGAVLVTTSTQEWRNESKIDSEAFDQSKQYSEYLSETKFMAFKLNEMTNTYIDLQNVIDYEKKYMLANPNDQIAINDFKKIKSSKTSDLQNKLKSYFDIDSDKSIKLISKLDDSFGEFENLKQSDLVDVLQLDLKNNIELTIDNFIDDMNYSKNNIDNIIEKNSTNSETLIFEKIIPKLEDKGNLANFNNIKHNLDKYQSFFNLEGIDSSNKLNDEWIQAMKSFEEYPGAAMEKFNALASVSGNIADFNELSKAFRESTENALKLFNGTIEGGLKRAKWDELNNEFQKIVEKEFSGQEFDKDLRDQLEKEMIEIERELNFGNGQNINELCAEGKIDPDDC